MTMTILVVDDEREVSAIITQQYEDLIAREEVSFIFAFAGEEALKILEDTPEIEIVLTDINMPVMNGLELLSHITKRWPRIKVIIISAYNDMQNIRKAMNRGAFDFITKPIQLFDVEKTIEKASKTIKEDRLKLIEKLDDHQKLIEIEKELDAARNIQSAFIPKNFNQPLGQSDYKIYGSMKPAKEVGGDFFDFFPIDEMHVGLVISDVSGKGVPAALFMTMARAAFRCFTTDSVNTRIQLTNEFLCHRNDSCMFVTLFYGVFNTVSNELTYCNAGHNPPLIISADGSITEIGRNEGMALGIQSDTKFKEFKLILKIDDCLFFYTDGVTEAMNREGEMYGETRLKEFLSKHTDLSPQELMAALANHIKTFVEGAEQSDDITMFCIKSIKSQE